jgi:quaternary ammonium compound-resistance protein SugE
VIEPGAGTETMNQVGQAAGRVAEVAPWAAWLWLVLAGVCEIGWIVGLGYVDGFRKLWPSVITVVCMLLSFVLLAQATRTLPVAMAYAIWVGIGTAGSTTILILLGKQPANLGQMIFLSLVVIGIIGLKLTAATPKP